MNVAKLTDLKPAEQMKILLFGNSGSGKTVFSCSFPSPIWVADFDNKISSAAQYYYADETRMSGIEYESYAPVDDIGSSFERFNNDLAKVKVRAKAGEIKTVVLDSMTTFGEELMRYLIRINPGIKRPEAKGTKLTCPTDYNILGNFMKRLTGELLDFPCNVICTAHIKIDKDETTGEITRQPMFPGQMAARFPIYFAEVYRAFVKDGKHFLQTRADQKFDCRTQIRGIPAEVPMHYDELVRKR